MPTNIYNTNNKDFPEFTGALPNLEFCTYLTTYSGSNLPPYYIGSTNTKNVLVNNYHGTICSKRYKHIFRSEFRYHPELFVTLILSTHTTRKEAFQEEYDIQKIFDVVKNPLYINLSYSRKNGFFGMSGKDHPLKGVCGKDHYLYGTVGNRGKESSSRYKGDYVTPWGTYPSTEQAVKNCPVTTSTKSITNWCIGRNNKKVNKIAIGHSNYLTDENIGKTYNELGFDFIPKNEEEKLKLESKRSIEDKKKPTNIKGRNNYQHTGTWVTPWGIFDTTGDAAVASNKLCSSSVIKTYCKKYNNKKIGRLAITKSLFLTDQDFDKTPGDLGFGFISI